MHSISIHICTLRNNYITYSITGAKFAGTELQSIDIWVIMYYLYDLSLALAPSARVRLTFSAS